MGLLSKVLYGIGSYLVEKDKQDAQAARDELLANRAIALKQLEFAHDDAASARDHSERLDEITATGEQSRLTSVTQGVIAERKDQASDQRDLVKAVTLKSVDLSNDAKMEALRQKYRLSEDQFQSYLTQAREAASADATVDHTVISPKGEVAFYNKNGRLIRQTGAGVGVPGQTGSSDDLASLAAGAGIGPAKGSGQARTAAPAPTGNRMKDAAIAQLGTAYAEASANPEGVRSKYPALFDPSGKLRPKEDLIAQVNARYGQ